MGRILVVSSGKGGVGKTTITANLGIVLARQNRSVCVVDADFGLNNLDVMLGLENRVVYDIMDVLKGNCRLAQGLIKDPIFNNLYILASSKQESIKLVSKADFKGIIMDLASVFDYVLIDSPAGIDFGFERAIFPAGEMLVVVTPTIASIRDAGKAINKAKSIKTIEVKIIINRMKWNLANMGEMLSHSDIESLLGEDVIGVIPENNALNIGANLKSIFETELEVDDAFFETVKNIENNTSIVYDGRKKFRGILGGLKNYFKKLG